MRVGVLRGVLPLDSWIPFLGGLRVCSFFVFWIGSFDLLVGAQGAIFFWVIPLGCCIPCLGGFVGTPSAGRSDFVTRDLVLPLDDTIPLLWGLDFFSSCSTWFG